MTNEIHPPTNVGSTAWLERYWPPRFTFTPEGIAGLFLRKHFATASGEHQQELAYLLRECVEQEREACAKACEALQVNKSLDYYPGQAFDGACRTCAAEIRKRSNVGDKRQP